MSKEEILLKEEITKEPNSEKTKFIEWLQLQKSKNGYLSSKYCYNTLSTVNLFNDDYIEFTYDNIERFIKDSKNKSNKIAHLKKYAEFLYKQNKISNNDLSAINLFSNK